MVELPIYMDHQATTPLDPRVLDAMLPYFQRNFGNPASRHHSFGWRAEEAVEMARARVAKAIGASDLEEIVFTSGATESNNLAVKGVMDIYRERGNHLITCATEHKSVLDPCRYLETQGFQVTYLPVAQDGRIMLSGLEAAITGETVLISIMHANNEIGVLQPVEEIGKLARSRGILFHCDAVQSVGKVPVNVQTMNADLLSLTAHKLYGPKGIGALYVRKRNPRVRISPLIHGGGHEEGLRSGTLNVPGIVGFGEAVGIAIREMPEESERLVRLKERLRAGIQNQLEGVRVNGSLEYRLPGNLNMSFAFVEGEALLVGINEEIAVSSGSACSTANSEPSYVLKALGVGEELARTSIRFGLGRFNTEEEVDFAIDRVAKVVKRLREISPFYAAVKNGSGLHLDK